MNNSTHYIKTSFRHDDYLKDILERAAILTKLSQSELIRNACPSHTPSLCPFLYLPFEVNLPNVEK